MRYFNNKKENKNFKNIEINYNQKYIYFGEFVKFMKFYKNYVSEMVLSRKIKEKISFAFFFRLCPTEHMLRSGDLCFNCNFKMIHNLIGNNIFYGLEF